MPSTEAVLNCTDTLKLKEIGFAVEIIMLFPAEIFVCVEAGVSGSIRQGNGALAEEIIILIFLLLLKRYYVYYYLLSYKYV